MKQSRYVVTNNIFSKVRDDDEIKLTDEIDSIWIPKKYFLEDDWNYNKVVISRNDIYKNIKPNIGVQYKEIHSVGEEELHEAEFYNPIDKEWHSLSLFENIPALARNEILPLLKHTDITFRKKVTVRDNETLWTEFKNADYKNGKPEYSDRIFVWLKNQWVSLNVLVKHDIMWAMLFADGYLFKEIKEEKFEEEDEEYSAALANTIDIYDSSKQHEIQVGNCWYPVIADDVVWHVNIKGSTIALDSLVGSGCPVRQLQEEFISAKINEVGHCFFKIDNYDYFNKDVLIKVTMK